MAGFIHLIGLVAFLVGLYSWVRKKEVGWVNTRQRAISMFLIGIVLIGLGAYLQPAQPDDPVSSLQPATKEDSIEVSSQALSVDVIEMAVLGIEQYDDVLEASIAQDGEDLSLAIKVPYAMSAERARQLGDNFVRMVKTISKDGEAPGTAIGRGEYDYLITVFMPNGSPIAQGAKVGSSPRITW